MKMPLAQIHFSFLKSFVHRLVFSVPLLLLFFSPFSASGQFGDPIPMGKTSRQPDALVVGDFTGDGLADFIFTEFSNRTNPALFDPYNRDLIFVRNLGQNRFSDNILLTGEKHILSLCRGDYDNDGKADILFVQGDVFFGGRIKTLRNLGNGSFAPAVNLNLPGVFDTLGLRSVSMQDLNQDGRADVLTNTGYYLSNGNGTFQNFTAFPASYSYTATLFDDLDMDGKNDIVLYRHGENFNRLAWLRNLGNGNFAPISTIADSLKKVYSLCVFHSTSTGKNHLLAEDNDPQTDSPYIFTWNTNGTFTQSFSYIIGDQYLKSSPMDAVAGKELFGNLFQYGVYNGNTGFGSSKKPNRINLGLYTVGAYDFGDTDGDGDLDIICGGLVLIRNEGNNQLAPPISISSRFLGEMGELANDLDQNGTKDAIYSSLQGTVISFLNSQQIDTSIWFPDVTYFNNWNGSPVFDINGDGRLDVIAKPFNNDTLMAYLNLGNRQFQPINLTTTGPMMLYNQVPRWLDLDQDGLTDILLQNNQWRKNLGNLNFSPAQPLVITGYQGGGLLYFEDLDQDSKKDFVFIKEDSLYFYKNQMPAGFARVSKVKASNSQSILRSTRDVNGDGFQDIIFYDQGFNPSAYLYLGLPGMQFAPPKTIAKNLHVNIEFMDLDADGDQDLVYGSEQATGPDAAHHLLYRENFGNELFGPPVRFKTHGFGYLVNPQQADFTNATGPDLLLLNTVGAPVLYLNMVGSMAKVDGTVFDDPNLSCLQESGESGLNNALVSEEFSGRLTSTFNGGKYRFYIPTGNFKIYPLQGEGDGLFLDSICTPANASGMNSGTIPYTGIDFGVLSTKCAAIQVDVNPGRMRRCVANYGTLMVSNAGPVSVGPQTVVVKFPRYVHFKSANRPWTWSASDSTYRFEFDSLEANSLYRISFKDSIPCTPGITGLRQGIRAWTLQPPPVCTPYRSQWDSSNLHVEGRNEGNGLVRLRVKNVGVKRMNPDRIGYFSILKNGVGVVVLGFTLPAGASFDTTYQADPGDKIEFQASNTANNPFASWVRCEFEATSGAHPLWLQGASGGDGTPHADLSYQTITDSFDPNDKQVEPRGQTSSGFLPAHSTLEYTIRFQNTGNDTAFVVNVVDSLSKHLDIATFKTIGSSHPFRFTASGTVNSPVLHWTFDKVNLLPKAWSEPKSQGFVTFSVRMKADLAQETRIENKARIYFDFNDPIITNTTLNVVKNFGIQVTEGVERVSPPVFRMYPNPARAKISISAPNLTGQSWKIVDLAGRPVLAGKCPGTETDLDISTLQRGLYFIRVGSHPVRRLVKE